MAQDMIRGIEETTIWSEVPDLRDKLVRLFRIRGVIDRPTLDRILDKSANGGGTISQLLLEEQLMDEEELIRCLEQASGYPSLDPRAHTPEAEVLAKLPADQAMALRSLPLRLQNQRLIVVMENPADIMTKQLLQDAFDAPVEPFIHHTSAIFDALGTHYTDLDTETLTSAARQGGGMRVEPPEQVEVTEDLEERGLLFSPVGEVFTAPLNELVRRPWLTKHKTITKTVTVPRGFDDDTVMAYTSNADSATAIVDALLNQALETGATDVHIEPMQDAIRVRVRQDQILSTMNYLAVEMHNALINRIKVLGRMDLAERRKIQESAFRFQDKKGKHTHFRVSVMPTSRGENAELRVIDGRQGRWDLGQLGMTERDRERFERNLYYSSGLILITGPTASGKTTTLYSALKRLNVEGRKIITAEDPIEYDLYGVTQVQVNPKIDMTYAAALKAFLRQDPDVMMLGEIRDAQTAQVAIGAALTGHVVLAAVHTNDAASAPTRLIQTLDCDPMLVCDALLMVTAQRLVRTLCPKGAEQVEIEPELREALGVADDALEHDWASPGCATCRNTGYRGVTSVFEVMDASPAIKELIFDGARTSAIYRQAIDDGMKPMLANGIDLVRNGKTNLAELKRVLAYKRLF